jgi:peptide/nickel transport system substrate-binding protein
MKTVSDPAQRANAMQSGQADMTIYAVVDPAIKQTQDAGAACVAVPQYGGTGFSMNMTHAPFDDVRLRQAFAYATDQKDLSLKATGGLAVPLTTFFPKGSPFYDKAVQPTNDLTKAQKLVDSYIAEKGSPKPINFVMATGFRNFGVVLAQQWSRLKGITVTVNEVPSAAASTALTSGTFDIAATGTQGVDPDDGGTSSLYSRLHTGSVTNSARFSDPAIDAVLDHARASTDTAVRQQDYTKAVKTMFEKVPYVVTYRVYQPVCSAKKVKGVTLFDTGMPDFSRISVSSS